MVRERKGFLNFVYKVNYGINCGIMRFFKVRCWERDLKYKKNGG